MRYAVVINIDYENNPYKVAKALYETVEAQMVEKGFRRDGRLFTIDLARDEACGLAREVIEQLDHERAADGGVYPLIKEFYAFDISQATNLLLPPSDDIGVLELDDLEEVEIVQLIDSRR